MTSKENQLAKEMAGLIKNIEEHTGQLSSGERIPQLELEAIVSKIKSLYEKSVVLKYLHAHMDEILSHNATEQAPSLPPENEVLPLVEAQVTHPEPLAGKKSLHEKMASVKSPSLAEKLQRKSVKNLASDIALHEKLMFQKELFNGNTKDYNEAVKHLETLHGFGEAGKYLEENFSAKYSWDKKAEIANVLFAILEKRYAE